jgi:hypothetical protein
VKYPVSLSLTHMLPLYRDPLTHSPTHSPAARTRCSVIAPGPSHATPTGRSESTDDTVCLVRRLVRRARALSALPLLDLNGQGQQQLTLPQSLRITYRMRRAADCCGAAGRGHLTAGRVSGSRVYRSGRLGGKNDITIQRGKPCFTPPPTPKFERAYLTPAQKLNSNHEPALMCSV